MDAVYVVGKTPDVPDYWELKMSMRSLHKNFTDLENVYVVGALPDWCQNVTHIPHEDPYRKNKDANLIQKLISACTCQNLSDEFMWLSDDQFLLRPLTAEEAKPPKYNDNLLKKSKAKWQKRARNTVEALKKRNLPHHIYECHCPYVLNKHLYPRTLLQYDYGSGDGYLVNTIYFNSISSSGHTDGTTCSAGRKFDAGQMDLVCSGRMFLNINHGYSDEMTEWMENRFPEPSPYEV